MAVEQAPPVAIPVIDISGYIAGDSSLTARIAEELNAACRAPGFFQIVGHDVSTDLRTRLFKEGFMKQPPNLLKQESGAAAVYVSILFRMYHDTNPNRIASREETQAALIPLCADIITSFIELDEDTEGEEEFAGSPQEVLKLLNRLQNKKT